MKHTKFVGTGVAMITPFKNNEVDYDSLDRIINHLIGGEIEYLVVLGSTGEAATLNEEEERKILDTAIRVVDNRIPIVAGNFGGTDTHALCEKIKSYNFEGIDAILSSSPAYVKPSQEGIYQHYMALADASPVPIILYNVPGRTKSNMKWETTVRIAESSDQIIGIKEASGDLSQVTKIIKYSPDNFFLTSGDDETSLATVACGGSGVISVLGNAYPRQFSDMIRAALRNDFDEARRLNNLTFDMHKWMYNEGNPVGIKSAMKILGLSENDVRLPLSKITENSFIELKKVMDTISKNS